MSYFLIDIKIFSKVLLRYYLRFLPDEMPFAFLIQVEKKKKKLTHVDLILFIFLPI